MKSKAVILFLISFFSIFSFAHAVTDTSFIYVAKNGNDANVGTVSNPFATLEAASDAIRQIN